MTITRLAPAKVNLTLEILGRRFDGFHEVRSVMQAISLHDALTFEHDPSGALNLAGGTPDAPADDNNLVFRAARALRERACVHAGARITLEKHIPVGAGLGGGSSDAATTLFALNDLWGCGLSVEDLSAIGATLGSDVPFFLTCGTGLATGRGEILEPLPSPRPMWLVLARPDMPLPTADVYRANAASLPGGTPYNASRQMVEALGYDVDQVARALRNDLQAAALSLCPEVGPLLQRLSHAGAKGILLSGSGSAVFGLCETRETAERIRREMSEAGYWSVVARTVTLPFEEER